MAKDLFSLAKAPSADFSSAAEKEEIPAEKPLLRKETPERLSRTLFVGNVPILVISKNKIQRALRRIFEGIGPVESLRIRSIVGKKNLPKRVAYITGQTTEERNACNAFVVMQDAADCPKAEEQLNGRVFEGRHLRVDAASNADKKPSSKKSVFVGNLPHSVDDEAVWMLFGSCGAITSVRIIRDKVTGSGKGFGYVTFKDRSSLELALQLNGSDCGGRPVRVNKCAKPGYQAIKKERLEKRRQKPSGQDNQYGQKASVAIQHEASGRSQGLARKGSEKGRWPRLKAQATRLPQLESRSTRPKASPISLKEPQHPAARRVEGRLRKVQAAVGKKERARKRSATDPKRPIRSSKVAKVLRK